MTLAIRNGSPRISAADIPAVRVCDRSGQSLRAPALELVAPSALVTMLQKELDLLVNADSALGELVRRLRSRSFRYVVFGGWVRDHIARATCNRLVPAPRDIDFVVEAEEEDLAEILGREVKRNIFGGAAFDGDAIAFDVWPLSETYLIAKFGFAAEFDLLPRIADFNINAVIFKPAQAWSDASLLEVGFFEALRSRLIKFQYEWIPFPRIQAARAIIYSAKLGCSLDKEIVSFVRSICRADDTIADIQAGISSYCPSEFLGSALQTLEVIVRSDF